LIKGLTEKKRKALHIDHCFNSCYEGKYRYRGPAGRLDTLHVLSERGRGKILKKFNRRTFFL